MEINYNIKQFNKFKSSSCNYENNNGNLISSIYGNGNTISYDYDDFDRIKTLTKMNDVYKYKYNSNGDLVKIISNNDVIKYTYDLGKRLYLYNYNDFKIEYQYDINSNVIGKKYELDNVKHTIINNLDEDDAIAKVKFDNNEVNYNYDLLGRLISSNINSNYNTNYEYISNGKRTTALVNKIINNSDEYSYKYDKLNNITHVYHNDSLENEYYYDEYNELIKENNYLLNRTIRYKYDILGNILYKKEYEINTYNELKVDNYLYSNVWKDQLTKYNDDIITYDEIGNPVTIGNSITLSWINGRQLNTYSDSNNIIKYKYNKDGVRTSKIVNNEETKYYVEGTSIVLEKTGQNVIYYIRSNEELVGLKYNDEIYYYIKNNQDDIIGIMDSNYNIVVKYVYDSWGNVISIKDNNGNEVSDNHIGKINSYRYRSYYYDKETKLYYLNSRYYNPLWGRFINADGIINANSDILSHNLYLYCSNDPINFEDAFGNWKVPKWMKKIGNNIAKGIEKVKKEVDKILKDVSNAVNSVKNAFVFEVGNGAGYGATTEIMNIGVSATKYTDVNSTVQNGKMKCSTSEVTGVTVGPIGWSTSTEIEFSCDNSANLENQKNYDDYWTVGPLEVSKNGVFVGTEFEGHFYVGGHIKIGFQFNW